MIIADEAGVGTFRGDIDLVAEHVFVFAMAMGFDGSEWFCAFASGGDGGIDGQAASYFAGHFAQGDECSRQWCYGGACLANGHGLGGGGCGARARHGCVWIDVGGLFCGLAGEAEGGAEKHERPGATVHGSRVSESVGFGNGRRGCRGQTRSLGGFAGSLRVCEKQLDGGTRCRNIGGGFGSPS